MIEWSETPEGMEAWFEMQNKFQWQMFYGMNGGSGIDNPFDNSTVGFDISIDAGTNDLAVVQGWTDRLNRLVREGQITPGPGGFWANIYFASAREVHNDVTGGLDVTGWNVGPDPIGQLWVPDQTNPNTSARNTSSLSAVLAFTGAAIENYIHNPITTMGFNHSGLNSPPLAAKFRHE